MPFLELDPVASTAAALEIARAASWGERFAAADADWSREPLTSDLDPEDIACRQHRTETNAAIAGEWAAAERRILALIRAEFEAIAKMADTADYQSRPRHSGRTLRTSTDDPESGTAPAKCQERAEAPRRHMRLQQRSPALQRPKRFGGTRQAPKSLYRVYLLLGRGCGRQLRAIL